MSSPAVRPRPSGGFNSGMGNFNDSFENLDENAQQAAMKQKALAQQGTSSTQSSTGGSALGSQLPQGLGGAGGPGALPGATPGGEPAKPRALGSIPEELFVRPAQDIAKGLMSLFDINTILGINPDKDDPQTKAKKQQMLQRWNKLNDEQQALAQKKYQAEMKKKQQQEQEAQAKKQQEEQAKANSVVVPSSPKKGPVGPSGSGKQKAVNKLEQDRKTLGGPKSVN